MRVIVTGAHGFLGRNLCVALHARPNVEMVEIGRSNWGEVAAALRGAAIVFHLAGVNRPSDDAEFTTGNAQLTRRLADAIREVQRPVTVLYASSTQALAANAYGRSKREAEDELLRLSTDTRSDVFLFRLPNVFGKWGRPNYNSVVATFCHNVSRGIPIQVTDSSLELTLVYVDDVVNRFISVLSGDDGLVPGFCSVGPEYRTTVGELARMITELRDGRERLAPGRVGVGLCRGLFATYLAYAPEGDWRRPLTAHRDIRGAFAEVLKTSDSGQVSYFTVSTGARRGGHFHHTKCERFVVVAGEACFRFRHAVTGEQRTLVVSGQAPEVIESVPGWAHEIENVGSGEVIVLVWANEVFDGTRPDTWMARV